MMTMRKRSREVNEPADRVLKHIPLCAKGSFFLDTSAWEEERKNGALLKGLKEPLVALNFPKRKKREEQVDRNPSDRPVQTRPGIRGLEVREVPLGEAQSYMLRAKPARSYIMSVCVC